MKKFNWDEFKNKDNKIVMHCKTEEEAKDFCRQMHGVDQHIIICHFQRNK